MTRTLARICLLAALCSGAFAQSAGPAPKFEVADVHSAAGRFMRGPYVGGGRYEIRTATMLDLIRTAYTVENVKIYGGPNWLEMDRFDVIGKLPAGTNAESRKVLLQGLLADRFKLVVHNDTKPMPAYALTAGKHGGLKEADPAGETGCKLQTQSSGPTQFAVTGDSQGLTLPLTVYTCHNLTMASFAEQLARMAGVPAYLNNRAVVDQTGLKGAWDFTFKYSNGILMRMLNTVDNTSLFDAIDKQLGLKLEAASAPTAVLVVDSVNRQPSGNSPEVLKSLPATPTEFEVAEIKPSTPGAAPSSMMVNGAVRTVAVKSARGPQIQNGRVNLVNQTLKQLLMLAWDLTNDTLVGAPKFTETDRYDVIAEIPKTGGAYEGGADQDTIRPMLRALLTERFKIAVHQEERPGNAFVLTAVKPKLKPADPANRTKCQLDGPALVAVSQAQSKNTCSNITMAEFVGTLPNMAAVYVNNAPVIDETGLAGAWDFSLTFSMSPGAVGGGRGGPMDAGGGPTASDPSGGMSLFDALNKQLGLKLEAQKRPVPVIVIDHIEPKPIEN